jgi:hypothetical protein
MMQRVEILSLVFREVLKILKISVSFAELSETLSYVKIDLWNGHIAHIEEIRYKF